MEKNKEQKNIEERITRIKVLWLSSYALVTVVVIMVVLLSFTNILPIFNTEHTTKPTTGTNSAPSTSSIPSTIPITSKTLSINYITPILMGLIVLTVLFGVMRRGRAFQTGKVLEQFFERLEIKKTGSKTGTYEMDVGQELDLEWLDRGYFKIIFPTNDTFYAKSGELYWKLLLLTYKIEIDTRKNIT